MAVRGPSSVARTPVVWLLVSLVFGCTICAAMTPDEGYQITSRLSIEKIKESWSSWPVQMMQSNNRGVYMTRPGDYEIGGLAYKKIVDMVNEFQFDYHFSIGESKPKPVAEREGEEQTGHADTFVVQFSHSLAEVEPAGEAKDHIPVDGGIFLVQFGEKSTVISFKRFNSQAGISQRYLDLIYNEVEQLKKSKKQYVCEIKKPNLNSLRVRIYGHANSGQLRVSYQTSQKEEDYTNCFLMNHYDRHIGHNFFYNSVMARTPDERNSEMFLSEASLKVDRVQIDFEHGGTYDKRIYERITSRMNSLDQVKRLPKKVLGGLLKIQNIMVQKSEHLEEYALDFHKGLQSMQEHFLTTIGKTKSKKVSDVGILRNLMEMLAELEAKQGRIYTKFSKLHQLVSKASGNDQLESEIASLNSVVVQLSNNLESRGLSRIVEECKTLVRIFKEISSHKEGIANLVRIQQLGYGVSEPSSWLGYVLIGGFVIALGLMFRTFTLISKSRKTHFL